MTEYGIKITIDIPQVPRVREFSQRHYHGQAQYRRYWRQLVKYAVLTKTVPGSRPHKPWDKPWQKCRLVFDVYTSRRGVAPDPDNVARALKPAVDGLQPDKWVGRNHYIGAGVIANDGPENFEGGRPEYHWHKVKRGEREYTSITIEEVIR